MGSKNTPERKKFRVAVSGSTIDGREISGEMLRQAAENYDPSVYASRVNIEHVLSMWPSSELCAVGDLIALSTDEITEGKLAGRTALYAEIEPTDRMKNMIADGKKVYSSIEMLPELDAVKGPYIVGLAMTDTPASLGTERLKFAAQQRASIMQFSKCTTEPSMFTVAMEAEMLTTTEQRTEESRQWFSRVMALISKTRTADGEQFSQLRDVVENIASDHADLIDRFSTLEQKHA
ncbi:TPA: GPO family capsid scaffolding protein, partial [Escherichia coli]